MASIVTKFQRCGKENCHCKQGNNRHGPYFWMVRYIKARGNYEKGKYKWKYIGKTREELKSFITENQKRYNLDSTKVQKKYLLNE